MSNKKVVKYTSVVFPYAPTSDPVGYPAVVVPVDHPDTVNVSNGIEATTTDVVAYDEATGIFETKNTVYVPEGSNVTDTIKTEPQLNVIRDLSLGMIAQVKEDHKFGDIFNALGYTTLSFVFDYLLASGSEINDTNVQAELDKVINMLQLQSKALTEHYKQANLEDQSKGE